MTCVARLLLTLALVGSVSALAPVLNATAGWRQGRATFYGGSEQYLRNFPDRGPPPEYGFGTPLYGSCGYLSQAGTEAVDFPNVPFPKDMLSAVANINDDFPGSCGRCYEIRCATGTVIGNYTVAGNDIVSTIPFNLTRGYTPKVDVNTVEDDYGRLWSGNDLMDQDLLFTRCYNLSQSLNLTTPTDNSIYVRVTDSCPCLQFDGGSKTVTGTNPPCCGNVNHFDLSFFGFEKLAHPIYGVMNTEFRPVDCYTKVPLDYLPGFINETIYTDNIESGWAWYPYLQNNKQLTVVGAGVENSNATCVDVKPSGGFSFVSRDAALPGYQPFLMSNATSVSLYVKQTSAADIGVGSGVPSGVTLSIGNAEQEYYCTGVLLDSLPRGPTSNGMTQLTVPIAQFNCDLGRVDQIGFQNTGSADVQFCLDNFALTGGNPADPHMGSAMA
ncbi:hypothetical protein ABBQ38_001272 [Trebouxia sp. C0009 RCD-2024]